MKFNEILGFFENLPGKFKSHGNLTRKVGILNENQSTFLIISHSVLYRMRNDLDKSFIESQNKHFVPKNISGYRDVYEVMWKDTGDSDRPRIIVECMRRTCRISRQRREYRHTHRIQTHSEYRHTRNSDTHSEYRNTHRIQTHTRNTETNMEYRHTLRIQTHNRNTDT